MPQPNTPLIFHFTKQTNFCITCLLALTIVLGACNLDAQTDVGSSDPNFATEQEKLMTLERKWSDMYGEGDVEGIAELLANESVLLAPGEPPAVGYENVLALTRKLLAAEAAEGLSVSWEPEAVFVSSSGDMAYDYGLAKTKLADGTVIKGSYLVVWTKEKDTWKIAADIFN